MRINRLYIKNFRGFEELQLDFDRQFNVFIGNNGSGKTAALEALNVAIGSFLLGIRGAESRHLRIKDIRIAQFEESEEYQFPVSVAAKGEVLGQEIAWNRELKSEKGRTTISTASSIKELGLSADKAVRKGDSIDLPILAYYSTARLFIEAKTSASSRVKAQAVSSRFRAYTKCLESKSTMRLFLQWYKGKEQAKIQKAKEDLSQTIVRKAIVENVPNCEHVFYEFDPDKSPGLKIILKDGRTLPFNYLSDGTRNYLALIADIAHKCVILNPHLKEEALQQTQGIVLIDELDLHLHPEWQKRIITSLSSTFPQVQFFVTTHSPFVIQETEAGQLVKLENNAIRSDVVGAEGESLEDIAENIQDVENARWSRKRQKLYEVGKKYYTAVANGETTESIESEMTEAEKTYTKDPLFYAYLEALQAMKT